MHTKTSKPPARAALALALAVCAAGVGATPASIDLSTGAGWRLNYTDVQAQIQRDAPAFTYDCQGSGAPQCLSVTSTGFAAGSWLPGATPDGFTGRWVTYVDFTLPVGATNSKLVYEVLGVDDVAFLALMTNGAGQFVATAVDPDLPVGVFALQGMFGAPGAYRLALEVFNGSSFATDGQATPIGGGDGTAVVGRFRVDFDLPGGTVPEPGTLACAGLALLGTLGTRRRPGGRGVSRPGAGLR